MNNENWIPICERLPAVSEPVLTYDEASRTRAIAFLNNGRWLRDYPDPMLRVEVRVTHWQPLPQLPSIRDAFEEWWEMWEPKVTFTSGEQAADRIATGHMVYKEDARFIWNESRSISQNK